MVVSGTYVDWCRNQLAALRRQLEPLQAGRAQAGKRTGDGRWIDRTAAEITMLKQGIAVFAELVERGDSAADGRRDQNARHRRADRVARLGRR